MRLIDAEALKAKWYKINDIDETDRGARFVGYAEIARLIDQAPTVSADVVRCKDCKHYEFADNRAFGMPVKYCDWFGFEDVVDDDFCSRGERIEP